MAAIDVFVGAEADQATSARAHVLAAEYEGQSAENILEAAINRLFKGRIALVSSFGADSSVLLKMVADIDKATPVVFIDTGKLFAETLAYRDALVDRLGLTDVRNILPSPALLQEKDPGDELWYYNQDACCAIRKVEPLGRAVAGYEAWITGRKRYQAATRASLPVFDAEDTRIKVNPLVDWTRKDIDAYMAAHDLPPHPLVTDGYKSIGCVPCTSRVAEGEDERAGRWRGSAKTECGIHFNLTGTNANGSGS